MHVSKQTLCAKIPITLFTAIIHRHDNYIGWLEDFIGSYQDETVTIM